MNLKNIISELKRRNVFKVATAYGIAGWLIIQVMATVSPQLGFPEWIPPLFTILILCGFPIALIIAWAFELTPDGLKKTEEVDTEKSITPQTGKKLNRITIISLALLVVMLVGERIFFAESIILDEDTGVTTASIAVLPFADLSPNGDQEYFSDGLSEELLNVLAKVENMKVAGRTSSFKFKGMNEDLKLVGEQLGVDHILEGSVRKSGNRIRITAQLIKVSDGFHLWSETYDRTYSAENLFDIQDEISNQVLQELKVKLLGEGEENTQLITTAMPTDDVEAYEAFLKGNELMRDRKADEILEAIEKYKQAIKLDPEFAMAFANLSNAYARLYEYGSIDKDEVADLIRTNADRALFIDSNLARAYAGLSSYYKIKEDKENELNAIEKAYDLSPKDPEIINWYGVTVQDEDVEKGDSLFLVAHELDPFDPVITLNTANAYYRMRDYDKMMELLDQNIERNPDFIISYTNKITYLRLSPNGKLDEAFIESYEGYKENPESLRFIMLVRTAANDFHLDSLARDMDREIIRLFPDNEQAESARRQFLFDSVSVFEERKDYEGAKEYGLRKLTFLDWDENDWDEGILRDKLDDLVEENEYSAAFDFIETHFPVYLSDTLTVHPFNNFRTAQARYVLEQNGYSEQAKFLRSLPCNYPDWFELEYDGDITKESLNVLYRLGACASTKGDTKKVAELLNEAYLVRRAFTWHIDHQLNDPWEEEILNAPEVAAVLKKISDIREPMQQRVTEYLKKEGVWKEGWTMENN